MTSLPNGLVSRKFSAPCFTGTVAKSAICLHYTAGSSVAGAVSWWQALYRQGGGSAPVGTPYIIDRDGIIYQVFDPETQWAWHLGIGQKAQDSRMIPIELVNWGPCMRGANGIWRPAGYDVAVDAADVVQLDRPWRGYSAYQKFPHAQIDSLVTLINFLCLRFSIPRTLPPAEWRTAEQTWPGALAHRGIVTHQHFRADKFDIGPAFDWSVLGV